VVGHFVDRVGQRRLLIFGVTIISGGVALLIVGAISRSLPIYFTAYLVTQVGVLIQTTVFNAIVADLFAAIPNKAGRVSCIFFVYGVVGAGLGSVAAGILFPVSEKKHNFYYFTALVTIISSVALLAVVQPSPARTAEKLPGEVVETPWHIRLLNVLGEWYGSELYHPWRRVVQARTLYFFSGGLVVNFFLYYLADCTDSKDPDASLASITVVAIVVSIIAAWPVGQFSDTFGSVASALISAIIQAPFVALIPTISKVEVLYIIISIYSVASACYQMADVAMITAALPNPDKRARDMGRWAAIENIGGGLGNLIGAFVLPHVGSSDQTVGDDSDDVGAADINDDDDSASDRTTYTRSGYYSIFWPAAIFLLLTGFIVWPLRKRLRSPTTDTSTNISLTAHNDTVLSMRF